MTTYKVVYRILISAKAIVAKYTDKTDEEMDDICANYNNADENGIYYRLEEEWDDVPRTDANG